MLVQKKPVSLLLTLFGLSLASVKHNRTQLCDLITQPGMEGVCLYLVYSMK